MNSPSIPYKFQTWYDERMKRLSEKEAAEARKRGLDYEHSLAIEGLALSPEAKAMVDHVDAERMGYEEAIEHGTNWLRERGLIPVQSEAAE